MYTVITNCQPISRCKHGKHRQQLSTHVNHSGMAQRLPSSKLSSSCIIYTVSTVVINSLYVLTMFDCGSFPGFRGLDDSLHVLTVVYGVYCVYVDKFVYRSLLNFHQFTVVYVVECVKGVSMQWEHVEDLGTNRAISLNF